MNILKQLGVYGYDATEPVILAALVTEDPLLLIGKAGTGKTFLLNSLSEALGLEHRHYNASLISFDDLVGFPWPEPDGSGIRYIDTPATAWRAESVLIDEINRCKPEHQNRLFSLVHERRIQGLKIEKLRYRWAAMNPAGIDDASESYAGCDPLDPALADRFAFLVETDDWDRLSDADRKAIADPRGDGSIARDTCGLHELLDSARRAFATKIAAPDAVVVNYCCEVAGCLGTSGLRISPRRVRQLVRNVLAVESVSRLPRERIFRLALHWSLPQRGGTTRPDDATVHAAHRLAWDTVCSEGVERWLHEFHLLDSVPEKLKKLLTSCPCADTGTLAVSQFLASEDEIRAVAFALPLYPLLLTLKEPPVGDEGLLDLGRVVTPLLEIDKQLLWSEIGRKPFRRPDNGLWEGIHPEIETARKATIGVPAKAKWLTEHVAAYFAGELTTFPDPKAFAAELTASLKICQRFANGTSS